MALFCLLLQKLAIRRRKATTTPTTETTTTTQVPGKEADIAGSGGEAKAPKRSTKVQQQRRIEQKKQLAVRRNNNNNNSKRNGCSSSNNSFPLCHLMPRSKSSMHGVAVVAASLAIIEEMSEESEAAPLAVAEEEESGTTADDDDGAGTADAEEEDNDNNDGMTKTGKVCCASNKNSPNLDAFVTFCARIHLREGHGLAIRDASGTSDPYVKCQYAGRTLYRSGTVYRELNPNWDEEFAFLLQDPTEEITFKVFDYDRFMKDDFMGAASVALSTLPLFQKTDFNLPLRDPRAQSPHQPYLGYLLLSITLSPLMLAEKEMFLQHAVRGIVTETNARRANKTSTALLSRVNVLLIQAKLSSPASIGQQQQQLSSSLPLPDTHAKFNLSNEKFKSKTFAHSLNPRWLEQFELHIFDENFQQLDVSIVDSRTSDIIGKCSIDLTSIGPGRTDERWHTLDAQAGAVHLLLTVCPCHSSAAEEEQMRLEQQQEQTMDEGTTMDGSSSSKQIAQRYDIWHSFHSIRDIGFLSVKVFEAVGLAAADLNGKSDPYCVLELVNARVQTQTVYKTLNPQWNRTFTFFVKDVHEVLELTVFDEDPNKKAEFLGKIAIPLLKIRNGEQRWYTLKNRKFTAPAKGRILVQATLHYNYFKAALRTFNPREQKFMQQTERFKRSKSMANINRLRAIIDQLVEWARFMQHCLSWQSYSKSCGALIFYILFVTFIQLWHLPLFLLLLLFRNLIKKWLNGRWWKAAVVATNRRKARVMLACPSTTTTTTIETATLEEVAAEFGSNEREEAEKAKEVAEEQDDSDFEQIIATAGSNAKQNNKNGDDLVATGGGDDERKSLKGRLQSIQDTMLLIQAKSDFALALLDRIRNTFNFTVPFCSFLALVVLCVATILLYCVPLRWILLIWGINKFSKRLRNPNYVDNNELLDFLSRVPTDKEIRDFRTSTIRCIVTPRTSSIAGSKLPFPPPPPPLTTR